MTDDGLCNFVVMMSDEYGIGTNSDRLMCTLSGNN
jgi:hypothetical protein